MCTRSSSSRRRVLVRVSVTVPRFRVPQSISLHLFGPSTGIGASEIISLVRAAAQVVVVIAAAERAHPVFI